MDIDLLLCAWNITEQGREILEKISQIFFDKDIMTEIRDTAIHTIEKDVPCLIFDEKSKVSIFDRKYIFLTGPLYKLIQHDQATREATMQKIQEVAEILSKNKNSSSWVEKNHITVGTDTTSDITITEAEAQHLKNIKDILNGGTVFIKKGDIEIRIEE